MRYSNILLLLKQSNNIQYSEDNKYCIVFHVLFAVVPHPPDLTRWRTSEW